MSLMIPAPNNMQYDKMNKVCYYPGWIDGFGQGDLLWIALLESTVMMCEAGHYLYEEAQVILSFFFDMYCGILKHV